MVLSHFLGFLCPLTSFSEEDASCVFYLLYLTPSLCTSHQPVLPHSEPSTADSYRLNQWAPYSLTSDWVEPTEVPGRRLGGGRRMKELSAFPQLPPGHNAVGWLCSTERAQLLSRGPLLTAILSGFWWLSIAWPFRTGGNSLLAVASFGALHSLLIVSVNPTSLL